MSRGPTRSIAGAAGGLPAALGLMAAVSLGGVSGCAHTPPAIHLTSEWPAQPGDYQEVTRAWTRSGSLRSGPASHNDYLIEQTLEVTATLESPEWRAAYVDFMAHQNHLPPDAIQALADEQKKDAADHYEVELMVATYHRRANDLQKGDRSIWRVALADDAGHQIIAGEIQRDRRPRSEIAAQFPSLTDFEEPYVARFPHTIDLLHPGARRISLRMSSAQGGVELVWNGAP